MVKIFITLIDLYRRYFYRGYRVCKYYPSCSEYAVMALKKYGVIKGVLKSVFRLLRCNPFSKGGIDFP